MTQTRNKQSGYRACADRGLTVQQTAEELGVNPWSVEQMARRHNIVLTSEPTQPNNIVAGIVVARVPVLPHTGLTYVTLPAAPWGATNVGA